MLKESIRSAATALAWRLQPLHVAIAAASAFAWTLLQLRGWLWPLALVLGIAAYAIAFNALAARFVRCDCQRLPD